jgi:hypothetical protein
MQADRRRCAGESDGCVYRCACVGSNHLGSLVRRTDVASLSSRHVVTFW